MSVQRPRAPRWPLLVLGALVVALVAAAIAIAGPPLLQPRATPSPSDSEAARGPSASPPAATGDPAPSADGPVGAADFGWASALWVPPANGGMPAAYRVQAGAFDDPGPTLDVHVPLAMGNGVEDAGRMPVFGRTPDGVVAFVADGGARSQLVRATLGAPDAAEVVAELDQIVWAMALERDGSHAYLLLVDRAERVDAGVVRVALDGSGDVTEVLPPLTAAAPAELTLAAVSGYRGFLMLGQDEAHLLRRVCADPALGTCETHVVELATGEVFGLPDGEIFALEDGVAYWTLCGQAGCDIGTTDVSTGDEELLAGAEPGGGWSAVVEADGRTLVALSRLAGDGTSAIVLMDAQTGEQRNLVQARGSLDINGSRLDQTLHILAPPGWIVATNSTQGGEARIAVRVSDGATVDLPPVPWRMPQMPQPEG